MTEDRELEEAIGGLNEIRLGRGQLRELGYARQRLIESAVLYEAAWSQYAHPFREEYKKLTEQARIIAKADAHQHLLDAIRAYNQIVQAQYAGH